MPDNVKVSIIVPVYKVEKYIRRCVDSLLAQTLDGIEILLIDDGSPDGCPAICDEYAKNDARVRVIHKENGGVSSARNLGIEEAKGEYIAFVDSDDIAYPEMCEKIYNAAVENDCECAMFDPVVIDPKGNEHIDSIDGLDSSCILEKKDFTPYLLTIFAGAVWRCLFKKQLLMDKGILFPLGLKLSEDRIFNICAFGAANKIYYLREPLYRYYILSEGACKKFYPDYMQIVHDTDRLTEEALDKYWDESFKPIYKELVIINGSLINVYSLCGKKNPNRSFFGVYKAIKECAHSKRLADAFDVCPPSNFRKKLLKGKHVLCLMLVGILYNIKNRD